MTAPIALQLYTLRNALRDDGLEPTLDRVARMGYAGVEPFGLDPDSAKRAGVACESLGLRVPSLHAPLASGPESQAVVETALALGTPRVVSSSRPDDVANEGALSRFLDKVEEARMALGEHGIAVGIHNHWWEFEPVEGRVPFDGMRERLPADVFFEVDVYWAATAGIDAATLVADLGERAPLLHVKDGPAKQGEPMVALGSGSLDIEGIVRAGGAEWLIVELDDCATDMFRAVAQSLDYLRRTGLGEAGGSADRG